MRVYYGYFDKESGEIIDLCISERGSEVRPPQKNENRLTIPLKEVREHQRMVKLRLEVLAEKKIQIDNECIKAALLSDHLDKLIETAPDNDETVGI